MKLRQKSKRDQTLDAAASVAKTWSEWRLGEKVAKTAGKAAKKTGKASKQAKKAGVEGSKRTPVKIAGAIALLGGIGAAVAKKLTGGKAEPLYTPPGPAPDMAPPPPSPVAVEDLAQDPPPAEKTPVPPTVEAAITASTEVPEPEPSPVVVEDLASDAAAGVEADDTPPAGHESSDAPAAVEADETPPAGDESSDGAREPQAAETAAASDDDST
jgi:hypothetical protein